MLLVSLGVHTGRTLRDREDVGRVPRRPARGDRQGGGGSCAGRVLVLPLVGGVTDTHYFAQKLRHTAYILVHMYILYTLCIFNVSNFT